MRGNPAFVALMAAWVVLSAGCSARRDAPLASSPRSSSDTVAPAAPSAVAGEPHTALPMAARLATPIDIDAEHVGLAAVLEYIAERTGANIVPNWAALEAAGVEMDSPVTLKLNNLPARRVMELVLEVAGGGAQLEPLDFHVEENIVRISTRRDLARLGRTSRTYDIRDLLDYPSHKGRAKRWAWLIGQNTALAAALADYGGPTREEVFEQVMQLFQDTVGQGKEWAAYGGDITQFRMVRPTLVFKASQANHTQFRQILSMLRKQTARIRREVCADEHVALLLHKASDHLLAGGRAAAVTQLDKAEAVDPAHPAVIAMRWMLKGRRSVSSVGIDADRADFVLLDTIPKPADGRDDALRQRLTPRIDVAWKATPLEDVLDVLRDVLGVNIYADWAALEAAGVEPNLPVTLRLKRVPAMEVLRLVVAQVGDGAQLEPLASDVIDGVLVITTERQLNQRTFTCAYDIRTLLDWPMEWGAAAKLHADAAGAPDNDRLLLTRDEAVDFIATTIQDMVGQQQEWAAYGGNVSNIRELNGALLIKTTAPNHAQIEKWLGTFRQQSIVAVMHALAELQIAPLLKRANAARLAERYEEAWTAANDAINIRPDHPEAKALKKVIEQTMERTPRR